MALLLWDKQTNKRISLAYILIIYCPHLLNDKILMPNIAQRIKNNSLPPYLRPVSEFSLLSRECISEASNILL